MKKVLIGTLAVFGVLSILAFVGVSFLVLLSLASRPGVPRSVILEIDFEQELVEAIPDDSFAHWMLEDKLEVLDVVQALERATHDRRVKALVARIGAGGMGMAHLQELRDAISRFRESGKPTVAYGDTFGEFGPGNGGYYLATAFDEIYIQPSGDVGLTGMIYESMFVRGLLDKLDVVPRMDQRHEYKNAMNFYTNDGFTGAHREAMQSLIDSRFDQLVRGIAERRGQTEQEIRDRIDRGPFIGQEALDAGLVDGLAYRDEVFEIVRDKVDGEASRLLIGPYYERAGGPYDRGTSVALVHAHGAVTRGPSRYSPMDGSVSMGSDTVAGALRSAIDDRRIKAILLRVDSPGGSYVASDTIWRETRRAKDAGKPVVVSMGNLAASGGYFVAMHADAIVAQPATITGSIGVLGGKLLTRGFWDKIGVTWDDVSAGGNADVYSTGHDYSESGYERFQAGLDRIYQDFTEKVADGRSLPLEDVQEVAKGRVWTGEQAQEHQLVDKLGGLNEALAAIREALALEADAPLRLRRYPSRPGRFDWLFGAGRERSGSFSATELDRALRPLQPWVRALKQAQGEAQSPLLWAPGVDFQD